MPRSLSRKVAAPLVLVLAAGALNGEEFLIDAKGAKTLGFRKTPFFGLFGKPYFVTCFGDHP